jgi:DNA mismatch repair protein MutL
MAQTKNTNTQIQLLPAQLANQIAAGEVVERPASVVKELLENSIDAGADSIHVEIDQGGHKRILIRDTGKGIVKDELSLALSRHATSKIRNIDDLESISSMGFRGEALASISSVSRLSLTSRPESQSEAWQANTQGMDMDVNITPAAHPFGTSIEVLDLFFNTPARRKFLRAQKTEFQHIEQIIKRIALSHPKVAFLLKHNGKLIFKYNAGKLEQRVASVCGQAFIARTTALDYRHENTHLSGWCSKMGEGWPTNDQQYIFVNQRMIRDKLVLHALRQAYEGMLPDNQFPAYILFLTLPAQDMDINVHPAKHEVRFHQSRQVHDVIFQAISQALVTAQAHSPVSAPSPMPSHDYIRPLEEAGGNLSENQHNNSSAYLSSGEARRQSTSSAASTKSSGGAYRPNLSPNITEAGHQYQNLMSTAFDEVEAVRKVIVGKYFFVEQINHLIALPVVSVFAHHFKRMLNNGHTRQPLLMPVSVLVDDASNNDVSAHATIELLQNIGCVIDTHQHKCVLKQVPSALRALPWAHMYAKILQGEQSPESTEQCLELISQIYLDLAWPSVAVLEQAFNSVFYSQHDSAASPADTQPQNSEVESAFNIFLKQHGKPISHDALLGLMSHDN